MNLIIKILPLILIGFVFYFLVYNVYPQYQQTLELVKKFNALKNKESELDDLERLINNLSRNVNLRQLMSQTSTLDIWLPQEPKIEEIIYYLASGYQSFGLNFSGTEFKISQETQSSEEQILSRSTINFVLSVPFDSQQMTGFIDYLEKSARLMVIKKAFLVPQEPSKFEVETYFMPLKSE